jgi:hypothetical protein
MESKDVIVWLLQALWALAGAFASFIIKRLWSELDRQREISGTLFKKSGEMEIQIAKLESASESHLDRASSLKDDIKEFKNELMNRFQKLEEKLDGMMMEKKNGH